MLKFLILIYQQLIMIQMIKNAKKNLKFKYFLVKETSRIIHMNHSLDYKHWKNTNISYVNLVENLFQQHNILRNTSTPFIRDTSPKFVEATIISNVNLAGNPFQQQIIWKNTSPSFMKVRKTTNVNLVEKHFHIQVVWRVTSTYFMRATNITNVNLVENHFL